MFGRNTNAQHSVLRATAGSLRSRRDHFDRVDNVRGFVLHRAPPHIGARLALAEARSGVLPEGP
jgi:hypothetical protein